MACYRGGPTAGPGWILYTSLIETVEKSNLRAAEPAETQRPWNPRSPNFSVYESPGQRAGLEFNMNLTCLFLGPVPKDSDIINLGWSLGIFISTLSLGASNTGGLWTMLEKHCAGSAVSSNV